MIFNKVIEIGRRHFKDGRMKILSTEGGGRYPGHGFQKFDIAEIFAPAEMLNLTIMDFNDLRKSQEQRFMLHLASSSKDFA